VVDTRTLPRTVTLAAVVDVVAVLAFAAVGRSSHAEGVTAPGVLETAAPFLFGLLVGWVAGRVWRAPLTLPLGMFGWAGTVVVGLAVRAAFTHRLPVSFVLVATVSLAVFLLGWRAAALLVTRATRTGRPSN
jgi:Protein of unknown function (DUF3054)